MPAPLPELAGRSELPAFPILIPLAAAAFALLVLLLRRGGALNPPRALLALALCVYGAGVLRSVLLPLPIVLGAAHRAEPWWWDVQLVPLATVPDDPSGMALNVLLFVPLGVLLPLVMRSPTLPRVLLIGALASLGIELVQLVGDLTISAGRIADVDDLIGNTTGTALGWLLLTAATRVPALGRVAVRLALPGADARRGTSTVRSSVRAASSRAASSASGTARSGTS